MSQKWGKSSFYVAHGRQRPSKSSEKLPTRLERFLKVAFNFDNFLLKRLLPQLYAVRQSMLRLAYSFSWFVYKSSVMFDLLPE